MEFETRTSRTKDGGTVVGADTDTPVLVILRGGNLGVRFPIEGETTLVGRVPAADIVLQDPDVSRRHCQLLLDRAGCRLVDLGSANGTFVNGKQVTEVILADGDKIRVGQVYFKFFSGQSVEYQFHKEVLPKSFFHNVSHEFRTLLTLIISPLDAYLRGYYGDVSDSTHKQLNISLKNARRLQRLVDQFLDLAKLEAGKAQLRARRIDLPAFAKRIVAALEPLAKKRNIRIHLENTARLDRLYADPDCLSSIFFNLLSNALKFMDSGGAIFIEISETSAVGDEHAQIRNILVVGDDEPALASLTDELGKKGGLETARTANDAKEMLTAHRFRCVIADADMENEAGLELLTSVAKDWPECYRVAFTGQANPEWLKRAFNESQIQYILYKPWDAHEALPIIRRALAERGSRQCQPSRLAEIAISDTGCGIPAKSLPHIFDRFAQMNSGADTFQRGTGLGLALVKELLELHQGQITVASLVGKGSTFTFTLPLGTEHLTPEQILEEPPEQSQAGADVQPTLPASGVAGFQLDGAEMEPPGGSASGLTHGGDVTADHGRAGAAARPGGGSRDAITSPTAGPTILVVEDNAETREFLVGLLSQKYLVFEAPDGKAAWSLLQQLRPSLVLSDVMMSGLTGLELCQRIKTNQQTQDTPVVLLSALGGSDHKVEGHQAGADLYVAKPFAPAELLAGIDSILGRHARRVEATAKQQQSVLETLVAGMAHELGNASQAIQCAHGAAFALTRRTLTDVSRDASNPDDQTPGLVEKIENLEKTSRTAVARISTVVAGLHQYTAHNFDKQWHENQLDGLARQAVEEWSNLTSGVEAELELSSLASVRGPRDELRQLILNLLLNARQAINDVGDGHIAVKTIIKDGHAVLIVEDNGAGIAPDTLPHIFDLFFTTKDPGRGMGLGLAVAKRIATDVGATISVETSVGQGARFTVQFPMSQTATPQGDGRGSAATTS